MSTEINIPKTNLILDFDGVLANTLPSLSKFLSKFNLRSQDYNSQQISNWSLINKPRNILEKRFEGLMSRAFAKYLSKQNDLIFEERMQELLLLNCPKAILTKNYTKICTQILQEKTTIFDHIITQDQVETKLEGLEIIFKDPKFDPNKSIFITDTLGDILEIAQRLDITQIYAVNWGYNSTQYLYKHLPESQILSDFVSLANILDLN